MVSVLASNSNTKGSVEVILSPKEASLLSASLLSASLLSASLLSASLLSASLLAAIATISLE